jgi:hypothetical protein
VHDFRPGALQILASGGDGASLRFLFTVEIHHHAFTYDGEQSVVAASVLHDIVIPVAGEISGVDFGGECERCHGFLWISGCCQLNPAALHVLTAPIATRLNPMCASAVALIFEKPESQSIASRYCRC